MVKRDQSLCTESIDVVCLVKDDSVGLTRTLLSILEQEFQPRLVLVSPSMLLFQENSIMGLLQGIDDYRIIHDQGDGIYQAMNFAINNLMDDSWVWFLNAGDTIHSSSVVRKVRYELEKSDSNWIVGRFKILESDGREIKVAKLTSTFSIRSQLFAHNFVSHQAVIMRLSLLKILKGFDLEFKVAADWDLLCRASQVSQPEFLDALLVNFYLGGFSSQNRRLGNKELLILRFRYLSLIWQPMSLLWYLYRIPRNLLVTILERRALYLVRSIRYLRNSISLSMKLRRK